MYRGKVLSSVGLAALLILKLHPQVLMAPKDWSNRSSMSVQQLVEVLRAHSKLVERCSWKAMDPEQFADSFLAVLKEVGRFTVKVNKTQLLAALMKSKVSLTSPEMDLFCEKFTTCIKHCKKRLRDAGSGARLPKSYKVMYQVWKKNHGKGKSPKKKMMMKEDEETQAGKASEDTKETQEGDALKEPQEGEKPKETQEGKASKKTQERMASKVGEAIAKGDELRALFGLPPKKVIKMDIASSSSETSFLEEVSQPKGTEACSFFVWSCHQCISLRKVW